eukprot:CAMPEP_0181080978 /NCGR_PEP_ID=MMETSP1071-20121207/2859_1 /TAXON_ID=35127 /ORGANISM="Thalassiosira sp., Strain NH16" /LENGTH=389 /DNA_ID=CAMNT_0023162499 /DNA_START=173 /DNA_END=1342 /DNA_ORIENTATION=-
MASRLSPCIVIGIVICVIEPACYHGSGCYGVLGFSSISKNPLRTPTALPVATIDAAELFDGTLFSDDTDAVDNKNGIIEICFTEDASTKSIIGTEVAGTTSRSSLAWAALMGAMLSLSAVPNAHVIVSSLRFVLASFSSWYLTRLEAAPLLTKCITGGIIALCGDYGAQWFEHARRRSKRPERKPSSEIAAMSLHAGDDGSVSKRERQRRSNDNNAFSMRKTYDVRRGLARFLECLLISSPLMHYGYDLFESILPVVVETGGAAMGGASSNLYRSFAALTHVLADGIFLDGIFVFTGILATGLFEGRYRSPSEALLNLRNAYLPTLKASVMTSGALIPLQFLSFRFLPVQLRVLSVNAVDLIWTGVVSFASHTAVGENDDVEAREHSHL